MFQDIQNLLGDIRTKKRYSAHQKSYINTSGIPKSPYDYTVI